MTDDLNIELAIGPKGRLTIIYSNEHYRPDAPLTSAIRCVADFDSHQSSIDWM
jgi:hypothetical protein